MSTEIVELVSAGAATTRAEIAEALGWPASTVSVRVAQLLDAGVLSEGDAVPSRGGRRGRALQVRDTGECALVADIGGRHARVGAVDLGGTLLATRDTEIDVALGPESTLEQVLDVWRSLAGDRTLAGAGFSLPGPVDPATRSVVQASRMPGWSDVPFGDLVKQRLSVPAVVENDADAMALGEHHAHRRTADSVTVKVGTAIGSGLVVDGHIYHGWSAGSGNITHTRVDVPNAAPCSCGNVGCLETVASGAGILRLLHQRGVDAAQTTSDVVRLANNGDPEAMTLVRAAGGHLGAVLCTVVNFMNPSAVYLGGALSAVEPFVAAVRSRIYEGSHPIATGNLVIEGSAGGRDSALLGIARLTVQEALRRRARRP